MCLRFKKTLNETVIQKHLRTYMGYKWLVVGTIQDKLINFKYPLEPDDISCVYMFLNKNEVG